LIDIFKSIPSLAIFLLPGGAVLLPIFIKLIPKLLPSSFDENRIEK
ncbi:LETM1 domain-containing protein, partial [Zobellia laminariae]